MYKTRIKCPLGDKVQFETHKLITEILKLIPLIVLGATYLTVLITFTTAYLLPAKEIIVTINSVGEAVPEAMFLIVTLPITIQYLIKRLHEPDQN